MRQLVDLYVASEPRDLDDWYRACDDHLHAVRTRQPAHVRNELLIDLAVLKGQIEAAGAGSTTELKRVEAALATMQANVLTRLGDHGAAIRWWHAARAAADATGDLELRLGVRATEAGHGRYGQRSPHNLLRLSQDAVHLAGARPTLGKALVTCAEAKALSAMGRHSEAVRTLRTCEDLYAAAGGPPDIMPSYWYSGQLEYAKVIIHAAAGNEAQFDSAMDRSLDIVNRISDHQYASQIMLKRAMCTIVNGGVDTGAREAAAVLDAVPVASRTNMITAAGQLVLRAVPVDQRERPAVRELRDVLVKTAPPRTPPSSV
ncbi:MAG: hypothetical protein IRY90_08050 [Actinomadura rubrobrunea]|nr:hypothetical protein [Actinomadura rubrobrunea]